MTRFAAKILNGEDFIRSGEVRDMGICPSFPVTEAHIARTIRGCRSYISPGAGSPPGRISRSRSGTPCRCGCGSCGWGWDRVRRSSCTTSESVSGKPPRRRPTGRLYSGTALSRRRLRRPRRRGLRDSGVGDSPFGVSHPPFEANRSPREADAPDAGRMTHAARRAAGQRNGRTGMEAGIFPRGIPREYPFSREYLMRGEVRIR
jgi:hypothetical protein